MQAVGKSYRSWGSSQVFTRGQFWPPGIVVAYVCLSIRVCGNHLLVRPWVPRLFHRPDCFMVSILCAYYIPILFHSPDCFMVSTRCMYTMYSLYIAVACWTPYFGAQERDIFCEIVVTPWTQFAGDNFSRNLLTTIAFVLGPRETIFRETNSSLPVSAGWNTCFAVVSHARRSIDTSIVSQSRVQLIQCQCKSQLQIANLGINKAFLIKSLLFDHTVYIRHLVQTLGQFRSESRARDW